MQPQLSKTHLSSAKPLLQLPNFIPRAGKSRNQKILMKDYMSTDYYAQSTAPRLMFCKAEFSAHVIPLPCRAIAGAGDEAALQEMKTQSAILKTAAISVHILSLYIGSWFKGFLILRSYTTRLFPNNIISN